MKYYKRNRPHRLINLTKIADKSFMRIIALLILSITFNANAYNCNEVSSESNLEGVVIYLNNCLEPEPYDPNKDITQQCGEYLSSNDDVSCIGKNGTKISSCNTQTIDNQYCFNGKIIIDQGYAANKNLMNILCTDAIFAPVPVEDIGFGICDFEKDNEVLVAEGKAICSCTRKDNSQVASWSCTNKNIIKNLY